MSSWSRTSTSGSVLTTHLSFVVNSSLIIKHPVRAALDLLIHHRLHVNLSLWTIIVNSVQMRLRTALGFAYSVAQLRTSNVCDKLAPRLPCISIHQEPQHSKRLTWGYFQTSFYLLFVTVAYEIRDKWYWKYYNEDCLIPDALMRVDTFILFVSPGNYFNFSKCCVPAATYWLIKHLLAFCHWRWGFYSITTWTNPCFFIPCCGLPKRVILHSFLP